MLIIEWIDATTFVCCETLEAKAPLPTRMCSTRAMHHRYPDSHCDLPGPSTVIWVRPYGAIPTFSIYSDVVSFGHVPVHLAACIKEERQKIPYRNTTQYKSDACIWATVSSLKKKRIEFHVEREKDLINEACMNESLRAGPTHTQFPLVCWAFDGPS